VSGEAGHPDTPFSGVRKLVADRGNEQDLAFDASTGLVSRHAVYARQLFDRFACGRERR